MTKLKKKIIRLNLILFPMQSGVVVRTPKWCVFVAYRAETGPPPG